MNLSSTFELYSLGGTASLFAQRYLLLEPKRIVVSASVIFFSVIVSYGQSCMDAKIFLS